mgnify:CR=1 FL=1
MKVGDVVRYRRQPCSAIGIIVKIKKDPALYTSSVLVGHHSIGVAWNFMPGQVVMQRIRDLEVISESR